MLLRAAKLLLDQLGCCVAEEVCSKQCGGLAGVCQVRAWHCPKLAEVQGGGGAWTSAESTATKQALWVEQPAMLQETDHA